VGARHVQVVPGSYRIVSVSRYARALLDHLNIQKGPGDCLTQPEVGLILDFYVALLQAAISGNSAAFQAPVAKLHEQVAFHWPVGVNDVAVTFSGGVGELAYARLQRKPWPPTTHYGDLGIDLAQRIVSEPLFAPHLKNWRPTSGGRATAFGLLRHATEVSGSTLFLPDPGVLPLSDVPILGSLSADSADDHFGHVLELARRSSRGGCVQVRIGGQDAEAVSAMGTRIARALQSLAFPRKSPLVLLVQDNVGKVLGHYATQWGSLPVNVIVIDEIAPRDAQYVRVGAPRSQVVPVSFYGLNEAAGDA
jgi:ethanolamine utilization protein EutA